MAKKENHAIVITSIIAAAVIVIALLAVFVLAPAFSPTNTMTVQGSSTIKVMPDVVAVYFSIQTNGSTSSAANNANGAIYDQLKATLLTMGFNESQIQTQSYSIYPNVIYDGLGKSTTNGYIASHSVKIDFSANDTQKISSVIDAGANSGAGISTIDFELSTALQNKYKAQALSLASQDAKTKADAVASGFGKSAGSLVSVSVNNFGYYPWPVYTSSGAGREADNAGAKSAVMNLAPTTQDVTADVSATYRLR